MIINEQFSMFLIFKNILIAFGGFLLIVGGSFEPSIGIWITSLGGSLIMVALGKDQGFRDILLHIVVGLFCGIFGSQIIHSWYSTIPQIAISFFASVFGVNMIGFVTRNLLTSTFGDLLEKIMPWKKKDMT